jgi:aspartokinase
VNEERIQCGGLLERRDVSLVEVLGFGREPGQARRILALFAGAGVSLNFLSIGHGAVGEKHMSFCVLSADEERWRPLLDEIRRDCRPDRVHAVEPVIIMTLYGPHFLERHSLASEVFSVVCGDGIDTLAVCSSVNSISLVVRAEDRDAVDQSLRRRFAWPD